MAAAESMAAVESLASFRNGFVYNIALLYLWPLLPMSHISPHHSLTNMSTLRVGIYPCYQIMNYISYLSMVITLSFD